MTSPLSERQATDAGIAQIEIRCAYRIAIIDAGDDRKAIHAAVHNMLLACQRAGVDPLTVTAPKHTSL